MGCVAAVKARQGHALVVLRIADYQCFGIVRQLRQKGRQILYCMLSIGIDLQRMTEPEFFRFGQPGTYSRALALIEGQEEGVLTIQLGRHLDVGIRQGKVDHRAALEVLEQAVSEQRADLLVPLIEQARALRSPWHMPATKNTDD